MDEKVVGWFFILDHNRHVEIYPTGKGVRVVVVGETPQFPDVYNIPRTAQMYEFRKSMFELVKEVRRKQMDPYDAYL